MIDITPIIQALIALLASIITAFLIPWVKAHTRNEQFSIIRSVAQVAVMAAEQLYKDGHGEEKYMFAKQYANAKLAEMGLSIEAAEIEAAVREMQMQIVEVLDTSALEFGELEDDGK